MAAPSPPRDAAPERLLQLCAAGDGEAFHQLYGRYSHLLYGLALRITQQPALAADAAHDAFVQVWQQAGRFDTARGGAEAWLTSLVRYRALDIARRRGRDVLGCEAADAPDEAPSALDQLVGSAEAEALMGEDAAFRAAVEAWERRLAPLELFPFASAHCKTSSGLFERASSRDQTIPFGRDLL